MSIYIELIHGHHYPNEELDDWGFNGPVLGPFPFYHITYGCDVKLGDDPIVIMGKEIDFPTWDADGFINFLGGFYGDMSIFTPSPDSNSEYSKQNERTNEVFGMKKEQIPLLLNDPEEWIRIYAQKVLDDTLGEFK